jgi:type II secretory ATPase GspE/PulE/Tfp pilus assembly ATPase PilB-like protein
MNVGEKRRPQLGACLYDFSGKKFDCDYLQQVILRTVKA